MINMNWNSLTSIEQLEELDKISSDKLVVIFKHSTRCSISAASLNRLERKWDPKETTGIEPYFLDLITYRDVSNAIAERYAVSHQSPQVLVIKNGSSVYDNSHLGISYEELLDQVKPVST